jgi:methionyl-tRNA formyltransferase
MAEPAPLNIVFMGTPQFAVPTLQRLLTSPVCRVVGVVTAPDKPAGRGQKLQHSPVKECALAHGIRVLQPTNLKAETFVEELRALKPDLNIVVAFRMLPQVVWALPPQGSVNLHASLLPDYRGAAPIHWAVINGETRTGLTTFFIRQEIDTGNIIASVPIDIPADWTTGQLHDLMMNHGADLMADTVQAIAAGTVVPQPQDASRALHVAPKIDKETARLTFGKTVRQQYNFIRGMSPAPGAWTLLEGKVLKAYLAQPATDVAQAPQPGRLLKHQHQLLLGCTDGWLRLTQVQLEGRKRLNDNEFTAAFASIDVVLD